MGDLASGSEERQDPGAQEAQGPEGRLTLW